MSTNFACAKLKKSPVTSYFWQYFGRRFPKSSQNEKVHHESPPKASSFRNNQVSGLTWISAFELLEVFSHFKILENRKVEKSSTSSTRRVLVICGPKFTKSQNPDIWEEVLRYFRRRTFLLTMNDSRKKQKSLS